MPIIHTTHYIYNQAAQNLQNITDGSIALVVTSPPYPMIEMWDDIMSQQNKAIGKALQANSGYLAFELMHEELQKIWIELYRVLEPGGIACINIGDATRTINKQFQLYSNHAKITNDCLNVGFSNLPNIIWRKPTNAPNKFMGSGMLPPGAYVTLEHEYILIFRKGNKRNFKKEPAKVNRRASSYFWEERNQWFSDVWQFTGTKQQLKIAAKRERSAAYPFELAYRLISMFSVKGDTVLDPFAGTCTTTWAAIGTQRNSIAIEIDELLSQAAFDIPLDSLQKQLNTYNQSRLAKHEQFVEERKQLKGQDAFKYLNQYHQTPVITKQEVQLQIPMLQSISKIDALTLEAGYL